MGTGSPPRCPTCGAPTGPTGHAVPAPPPSPLDAEQLVRLTGAVLTWVLNAGRHPDAQKLWEPDVTLALGDAAGVPLPTEGDGYSRRLLPYGRVNPWPNPSSDPPADGGSRAP